MDRKIKDILYEDKFLQICQQTAKFAKLIQKHKKNIAETNLWKN